MRINSKIIILLSGVAALATAGGVTAGVMLYRGADAMAVKQGFARLAEDIGTRSEEVISLAEAADLIDEVMYGNAHIDMSVNVGGIDMSGVITDETAGTIVSGILGNLSDITIGADAVIDRRCSEEELSVTGGLSVMNYKLADLNLYVRGDMAYLELPDLADEVYMTDLSDISGTVSRSPMLSEAWEQAGLPRIKSVELFGEAPANDIWSALARERDEEEQSGLVRDMWKNAVADRRDEDGVMRADDEREITCRIYDVTIPKEDMQRCIDYMTGTSDVQHLNADVGFAVYIDEYKDIRRIETTTPIILNGTRFDISIELTGEELPVDTVDVTTTVYTIPPIYLEDAAGQAESAPSSDKDPSESGTEYVINEVSTRISRDGHDYDISLTSGDALAEVEVSPKYDRESCDLNLRYSNLSLVYAGEEILRSGGDVRICTAGTEVNVQPLPTRTTTDNFDLWAYDIAGHILNKYGALIAMF